MKKLLVLLLALVMVFSFAACTGGEETTDVEETDVTEAPEAEVTEETEEEVITLNFWHIWPDDVDAQRAIVEDAIAQAEEAFPNVDIVVTANSDEDNKVNTPLALGTETGPDIFYFQAAGAVKELVEAGKVLDLTPYYEADAELQEKLSKASLVYTTFDDKIYGYTYGNACAFIYYNKTMFEEHDVKVPETYDELLAAAETFSAAGVVPMSVAGVDVWPLMFQYGSLALKTAGAEKCNAALAGNGDFTDEAFIKAAEQLVELVEAGFYSESVMSVDYMGAQNALAAPDEDGVMTATGDAAMFYMGNWAGGLLDSEEIGAIIWPTNDSALANERFGGADKAFFVSASTEHPEVAAAVSAFITEKVSEAEAMPTFKNVPVDPDNTLANVAAGGEGYTLWWDTGLGGEKGNVCNGYIADLVNGVLTPEDFCAKMQELVTS